MSDAFSGKDENSHGFVRRARDELRRQVIGDALTIVEVTAEEVVAWKVATDQSETPRRDSLRATWPELADSEGALVKERLLRFAKPEGRLPSMIVCTSPDLSHAMAAIGLLRAAYPAAKVYRCGPGESVQDMLAEAIAHIPLRQRYDFLVLRRTGDDGLRPDVERLFASGTKRGDPTRRHRVRIEPAGEHGTAFAVVAADEDDSPPSYRLVSLGSAVIPPGSYTLAATLLRPGEVRFDLDGQQVWLDSDDRTLHEVYASIPDRLPRLGPGHLIIAVERCGPAEALDERLAVARRLVKAVAVETDEPVAYSVIGYADHVHSHYDTKRRNQDIVEVAWTSDEQTAMAALGRLERAGPITVDPPAAQLECVLDRLVGNLRGQGEDAVSGRPVIVTIGSRGAYPAPGWRSPMLPCPERKNWVQSLEALRHRHRGITFGAIYDGNSSQSHLNDQDSLDYRHRLDYPEIWAELGADAWGDLREADVREFAVREFAVQLGLLSSGGQGVPLPIIDTGGR